MTSNIVRANPLTKLPPYAQDTDRPYVGDPWSRQPPRESALAFKGFTIFLNMEHPRSITKVADLYLAETGKKMNGYNWSKKHRWEERALAYDNFVSASIIATNKRQAVAASVKHAKQAADVLDVLTLPLEKLRERIKAQGDDFSFIDGMDDEQLMKLARSFATDIPTFQKAERDALNSTSDTVVAPAQIKAKGEIVRRLLASREMIGLAERLTFEVSADVAGTNDDANTS